MITGIMLWFPEDLVAVQYRQTNGGNLTPVDQGSPGQKTAALLTVILEHGEVLPYIETEGTLQIPL
ncbi:hypothetical protein ACFCV3_11565 [Kribbella sp. NPDC056345]|uniref:hypothetical protein n=1 Tax=Kribbella sp. NPDC056345 TaxID=3345789 RepID=UPI0035E3AFB7